MKNRKYIAINLLSAAVLLFGATACTDDMENNGTAQNDGAFRFSAGENVYTRAAADEHFAEGTRYQLFAIDQNTKDWSRNLLASPSGNHAVIGNENSNHTIDYTGNNKFNGRTLSFYGVTASSQELLHLIPGSDTNAPAISVTYPQSGSLPDILWAAKEGQTYNNSGTIRLPFIHTLSKLNLLVQKHKDVPSNLAITKIELCDYASGSLNLSKGEFESSSETRETNFYTVFTGAQVLETTSAPLKKDGKNVEPTIFPTRSVETADLEKHSLGIKVTMSNNNTYTYWTKEVMLDTNNQPIKINGKEQYRPFPFRPNYEYDMQLTITESAMVVTILPRVYDWIPKEENQDNGKIVEVGNPVTFGGVTWMDRNLGATSADPTASEMDWERSRGFFYQFGRSIPYYIEGSMQDPDHEKGTTVYRPKGDGESDDNAKPYPFVNGHYSDEPVTWDIKGNALYTADKLAKKPSDTQLKYNFAAYQKDKDTYYRDWDQIHSTSATYWSIQANQPCPKGWRLPTKNEFLTIYPVDEYAGDINFRYEHQEKGKGEYGSEEWFKETKSDGVYLGVKKTSESYGVIHAIKNQGKSNAYGIKWEAINIDGDAHNGSKTKRAVLVISRYPATSSTTLGYANYKEACDWEHPTEKLQLPISGYVHVENQARLIYSGIETIYWTSEAVTSTNTAYSIRMKLGGSASDKELKHWELERRGYGCLIRCVRDNSVKE